MKCGSTFLLFDEDNPIPHPHIVITDPDQDDCVVLVSVTTERGRSDTMTRLAPGIHPFVTAPSVITYAYTKIMSRAQILGLIESGEAYAKEDASSEIVRRAQSGLRETDRAPQHIQRFFLEWLESNNQRDL